MAQNISPANIPPTSNTDSVGSNGLCARCGKQPLCDGLGVISYEVPVGHEHFGKLYRCPNHPIEEDEERRERLRKLSNLGAYAGKTFENFTVDLPGLTPPQHTSLIYAREAALKYARQMDGWLLLEGAYGCGKTHLAAAVGNARLEQGDMVLFITVPDLLDHLRSTYGPTSEVGYDQMFERIRSAQVLILDDLGAENPSAWAQEKLFQLLNHRHSHHLPTVITTNVDVDTLDARIRSRMLDEAIITRVKISAPDYRTPTRNQLNHLNDITVYSDMAFENFDVETALTPDHRNNLRRVAEAAWQYANKPQGWLVLTGNYGTGKTHLAAAIGNFLHQRGREVMFIQTPDLLDYLRVTFQPDSTVRFDQRFNSIRTAPFLILDGIGAEAPTPWAQEKLFQIIDHRYAAQLPTVITTARRIEDLGERIASRLLDKRRCRTLAIIAPSYAARLHRQQQHPE